MVIVARPFIILLISRSPFFFSLFSGLNKLNNFSSPRLLLFPQMHTNTPTHKHIHTDKSIQRYTCSKKKKKKRDTQTHPHTNKPKWNKETDRCLSEQLVLDWNDRGSWVLLDQSSWVSLDWSSWVWVLLDRS